MHARVDECGVCGGTNECLGCDGKRSVPPAQWDACGGCNASTNGELLCQYCSGSMEIHHDCEICMPQGRDPCSMSMAANCNFRGLEALLVWATVKCHSQPLMPRDGAGAPGQQGSGGSGKTGEGHIKWEAAQRCGNPAATGMPLTRTL